MKKIGIITTNYALNYGAVLQAYALEKYINSKENVNCEVIDYRPNKMVYGRNLYSKKRSLKAIVKNILIFFNRNEKSNFKTKLKKFDSFLKDDLKCSDKKYFSASDFSNIEKYDLFICGSDQIWNINLMDDEVFFIPFYRKHPNSKFISYAASIAEDLDEDQYKTINNRIQHLSRISVREKETAIMLSNKFNKDIEYVLDPVFLISNLEWKRFSSVKLIDEKYILCYFLGIDETSIKLIKKIKSITGLKVVNLGFDPRNLIKCDYSMNNVSPKEFVSLFSNADYICTNSFHATAFSIIFNKNFFTVKHSTRNLRMDNLFELFDLNGHLIKASEDVQMINESNIENNINNNKKINYYIKKSKDFIDKCLI